MVDLKMERPQVSVAELKPLLTALAVALLLLAAWIAWGVWQQYDDGARREAVQSARDGAVAAVEANLSEEKERFVQQLANPLLQRALAESDLDRAGALLQGGWPGATDGAVVPSELDAAYAALPEAGYGRVATLETALVQDRPVARVIQAAEGPRLAVAGPVRLQDRLVGVGIVHLPLKTVAGPVETAQVGSSAYLALRQSGASILERGDSSLARAAERMAVPVADSELRVAAAVPAVSAAPFGLGTVGGAVAVAVLVLLALLALRAPQLAAGRRRGDDVDATAPELTLEESSRQDVLQSDEELPLDTTTTSAAAGTSAASSAATGIEIDRGIFRAYDIRGIVGRDLSPAVAELIGHAIGTVMHERDQQHVVVGRDGRLSGPELVEGLIAGLRKAGREVVDIGMAPTPVIYFGAYHLRAGSCVSVTGSHNPPDYNGFKVVVGGETLSGDAILDLYARIADDRLYTAPVEGGLEQRNIDEEYVQRIASDIQLDRPLKVVVDAGNGVAGEIAPRVLEAIGAEVVPLYCEIDGTFPNHHPDPSEAHNLADLIQMVAHLDADLGVAFDGDGDRLGVVTRDGNNIYPDRLLMLFAADVLERNPGAQIIFDVKCTGRLPGHVLRHGGSPLMWKTGHSLIKAKMRETGAELAGEMSGHFFFKERWFGFDDGIYAAARLLEILAAQGGRPSDVLDALPDGVATAEIKVPAPGDNPHAFVEKFVASATFDEARLSTIDGLRVDWPDGWGLVRASNTTPVLVLRFDADNNQAMARIKEAFRAQLLGVAPELELPF